MPTSIEAQGVTVEEAIQVALNQLGVTRDRVEIEIVHHPRGGFLGLGARRAKVRATLRESALADGQEYDMSGGLRTARGRRGRRGSRRRRGGRRGGGKQQEAKDDTEQPSQRRGEREQRASGESRSGSGGRGGQRRRRGEDGRDQRQQQRRGAEGRSGSGRGEREPARQPSPVPSPPGEPEPPPTRAAAEAAAPVVVPPSAPPPPAPREPASGLAGEDAAVVPTDEVQQRALAIVSDLLRYMGFQAQVDTIVDDAEHEIVVRVSCDADGLLIGRRGQTLDAIEHLINRMVATGEASAESRVVLDVGGYRERRRQALLELADRLKVRAMTQNRRIQLSPMSPRDRRILQAVLAQDETIGTRVQGTGFYRRLVIFPAALGDDSGETERHGGRSEETETAESALDDDAV